MEIAHNDTDCDVCKTHFPMFHGITLITCIIYNTTQSMQLRPPKTLLLGELDRLDNKTGTVTFLFRNLVTRIIYIKTLTSSSDEC